MKWFFALTILPSFAWSAKIPVTLFDQSKLENLLRNIPEALMKTTKEDGFVRKHYAFPKTKSPLSINCFGDYFNQAPVPSNKVCEVEVNGVEAQGDEYVLAINDSATVNSLFKAMAYGKVYSTERVYGQSSSTGKYRQLFRYFIGCTEERCEMTFSGKEALY